MIQVCRYKLGRLRSTTTYSIAFDWEDAGLPMGLFKGIEKWITYYIFQYQSIYHLHGQPNQRKATCFDRSCARESKFKSSSSSFWCLPLFSSRYTITSLYPKKKTSVKRRVEKSINSLTISSPSPRSLLPLPDGGGGGGGGGTSSSATPSPSVSFATMKSQPQKLVRVCCNKKELWTNSGNELAFEIARKRERERETQSHASNRSSSFFFFCFLSFSLTYRGILGKLCHVLIPRWLVLLSQQKRKSSVRGVFFQQEGHLHHQSRPHQNLLERCTSHHWYRSERARHHNPHLALALIHKVRLLLPQGRPVVPAVETQPSRRQAKWEKRHTKEVSFAHRRQRLLSSSLIRLAALYQASNESVLFCLRGYQTYWLARLGKEYVKSRPPALANWAGRILSPSRPDSIMPHRPIKTESSPRVDLAL